MEAQIKAVEMPAGEYWVGDPCYAVPDKNWIEWLEAADYKAQRRVLIAEVGGHSVLGVGTAHGDGEYYGKNRERSFRFPVDAGLLGVVPVALAEEEPTGMQRVVFDQPFECSYENGTVVLGHIEIDTDPDEDEYL